MEYYVPLTEWLLFEEATIFLVVNDLRRIPMTGSLIIRHYKKGADQANCYRDEAYYLHAIFKEWLLRNGPEELSGSSANGKPSGGGGNGRNRTALLAQFQPQRDQARQIAATLQDEWPTYAVCFEIEPGDDGQPTDTTIQISFRCVNRHSFLITALDTYQRPVSDPLIRHCLMLERNADSPGGWRLRPVLMPVNGGQAVVAQRRMMLVAKHGWLAVFLKNHWQCYLLLENEYLVMADDDCPVVESTVYQRIMNLSYLDGGGTEFFFRRTTINHDGGSVNGVVVNRAVLQNEFHEQVFSLVGVARLNAILNLTYLQQLFTAPNEPIIKK